MRKKEAAQLGNGTPVTVKRGGTFLRAIFHKLDPKTGRADVTFRAVGDQVVGIGASVHYSSLEKEAE